MNYIKKIFIGLLSKFGEFTYKSDLQISESRVDNNYREDWLHTQKSNFLFNTLAKLSPFVGWSENRENINIYRFGLTLAERKLYSINLTYIKALDVEFFLKENVKINILKLNEKF